MRILLSIFHTGGLTLGLSLVALFLLFQFWKKLPKATKQEYGRYTPSGWQKISSRTPFYRINSFWFGVVVIVLYIVALLIVASDYKGV
jgi:hypothetical protein